MAAIVAALIVAAAALLVVGVVLERRGEPGPRHPADSTAEQHEEHHDEAAEEPRTDTALPGEGAGEAVERATEINVEAPWIVAVGTVVSIGCAIAVCRHPTRPVIAIVVAVIAAAVILDALEVRHQIGEGRIRLALLAAAIVALRAAAIAGSGYLYKTAPGGGVVGSAR